MKISQAENKGWSGEIPLQEIVSNNRPWLVKVPSCSKGGHTSFWVRILRETVILSQSESVNRVLVIIWPLFMLKSMLTVSTTAYEEKLDQNYSIFGRGEIKEFEMAGTDEDEHELSFRME